MGKLFNSKGAKIIAVSNTKESPASSFSDINFIIPVNIMSYVDAFTAPIAFLTSLLVEYAEQLSEEELNILHEYDNLLTRRTYLKHHENSSLMPVSCSTRLPRSFTLLQPRRLFKLPHEKIRKRRNCSQNPTAHNGVSISRKSRIA